MEKLLRDIRYAARRLRKSPAFSAIVVVTLALGIGANSAIFSVLNTVLLRPFPYREPGRLVVVDHFYPSLNNLEAGASAPGYRDLRDKATIFDGVMVETGWAPALTGMGDARRLNGSRVSGLFFSTLGVTPILGRALRPDEDAPGNNRVVVLSHGLWQREFGGERDVIGRTVQLNNEAYEIVGVMPPSFHDFFNRRAEIWTPLALAPELFADNRRTNEYLALIARLKPGVSVEQSRREMTAFAEQLKRDYPGSYGDTWTLKVATLIEKRSGRIRPALLILLGAVGFVLLIACANVANLMLARGAARLKEIAIRSALGASRRLLVRQLMTESLLLALIGGAVGLGLAWAGVQAVLALEPANVPRVEQLGIDGTVLGFTLLTTVVTGLLFGIVPAIQTSRSNLQDTLKEGGRSSSTDRAGQFLKRSLVVAQMALALTLLAGAGLLIKSFARVAEIEPGFDPERLLVFNLSLPAARYPNDTARLLFWDRVLPELRSVPGVQAAGATSVMPFGGSWSTGSFTVEGYQPAQGQPGPWGDIRIVDAGFHAAMRIPLVSGRYFDARDDGRAAPVAIVDGEMVRRFWPDTDPVGKRVAFGNPQSPDVRWITVVGVVPHTKHEGLDAENRIQLYLPLSQTRNVGSMAFAIRTTAEPRTALGVVTAAVKAIDPDVPVSGVSSMDELISGSMGQRRFAMLLLGLFAGLALALASIGIYGVMSYAVTQRAHELGVRMTLGATRADVLTLVMKSGMGLVLIGTAIGVAGALALRGVIAKQLYSVRPDDPATLALTVLALGSVAAVATLVPALRATRVDPAVAMREE